MRNINKLPAVVAIAGTGLASLLFPAHAGAQEASVGQAATPTSYILGVDASGQPDVSGAPNGYDLDNPLRFHQGGYVEVTSECDTQTGEGSSELKLTTVARKGEEHATVTWGMQQGRKEFFRQELGGGKTVVIPGVPNGVIDIAWYEEMDVEGADVDGMTVFDAVQTLEGLVDDGTISNNTEDDFRSYKAEVVVPDCEVEEPETTTTTSTTTSTTTTTAPVTTTTSTTVPETTTTVVSEATTTSTTTSEVPDTTTTTIVESSLIPPLCVAKRVTGEVVEVDCGEPIADSGEAQLAATGGNTDTERSIAFGLIGLGAVLVLGTEARKRLERIYAKPVLVRVEE